MTDQQQSHRDQRHDQHDQRSHQPHQDRRQFGHPEVQRREFLWRERVKLELQVQALLARAESLEQAWRALQQRKANLQHQKPKLAASHHLLPGRFGCTTGPDRGHPVGTLVAPITRSDVTSQRIVACFVLSPDPPLSVMSPSLSPSHPPSTPSSMAHHLWQSQHPEGRICPFPLRMRYTACTWRNHHHRMCLS